MFVYEYMHNTLTQLLEEYSLVYSWFGLFLCWLNGLLVVQSLGLLGLLNCCCINVLFNWFVSWFINRLMNYLTALVSRLVWWITWLHWLVDWSDFLIGLTVSWTLQYIWTRRLEPLTIMYNLTLLRSLCSRIYNLTTINVL